MGVTGLWTVVQPCARPIKIETLNKKRLAVDASIWIYQFLKAVRDKEGNALRNSHVVGFFRRICKLLFFGIKPVFVFDGGAPALKRQTISARKARREGRRDDAVRTAGKLLAVQMQRRAEEEEMKRRDARDTTRRIDDGEEPLPENLVYVEEMHMTEKERLQNRTFKKRDAYHLPDLDVSLAEMGAPNDPRIMSMEELEQYARQFDTGEDINVYDFSKIDFDSPFFTSLPPGDRYNILNAARLRSRLRMGYSKDQLDTMFQDRMAFSKFQIERVRERNELTQRLMHINGMSDESTWDDSGRVAGEKGREYVLIKNDGVEGGWALGVVSSKDEGERNKPIDLDRPVKPESEVESEEDDEFEDVPIEGVNRLPKLPPGSRLRESTNDLVRSRKRFYKSRRQGAPRTRPPAHAHAQDDDSNALFVADEPAGVDEEEWEDVTMHGALPSGAANDAEDEEARELQRAIQMSLENETPLENTSAAEDDEFEEVFHEQKKVEDAKPFAKGSGLAIARMANNRSSKAAPAGPFADASDSDNDDAPNLQSALAESRRSKHKSRSPVRPTKQVCAKDAYARQHDTAAASSTPVAKAAGFDGPLPFEKLDLGTSLLGKKKMRKIEEDAAGGFEKDTGAKSTKKDSTPLPPWFSSDMQKDMAAQKEAEEREREEERLERERQKEEGLFEFEQPSLRNEEIIDLENEPERSQQVIAIDSDDEADIAGDAVEDQPVMVEDPELRMGDLAEKVRAEPPVPDEPAVVPPSNPAPSEPADKDDARAKAGQTSAPAEPSTNESVEDVGMLDWSDSDEEATPAKKPDRAVEPAGGTIQRRISPSPSPSPEFEDVPTASGMTTADAMDEDPDSGPIPASGTADQDLPLDDEHEEIEVIYSDPEDDDLFRSLAQEEEEHARFASSLTNGATTKNADEYEKELRQLRNQQKKDRRDADEVTQVMVQECQQLLSLFGLPYITAPMEAEAQCAELVHLGLVDGIVTDDSDIFLFGGTRIYKNMFNQAKFVECYLEQDLQAEFGLSRERMIGLAQLLGSDYTEGLPSVGPVTAVEIMSEFDTLERFRDWWTAVQHGTRTKAQDADIPFRKKFRRNAKKLFLPPSFPDPRVEQAYLIPEVDSDPQPFVWGVPDLGALRSFLMATIGWSQERTDEILVPVIKDMNRRIDEGTQANITNFFGGGVGAGAFAPRRREEGKSRRLESALTRMKERTRGEHSVAEGADGVANGDDAHGDEDDDEREAPMRDALLAEGKSKKKRGKNKRTTADSADSDVGDDVYAERPKKARKGTSKKKGANG